MNVGSQTFYWNMLCWLQGFTLQAYLCYLKFTNVIKDGWVCPEWSIITQIIVLLHCGACTSTQCLCNAMKLWFLLQPLSLRYFNFTNYFTLKVTFLVGISMNTVLFIFFSFPWWFCHWYSVLRLCAITKMLQWNSSIWCSIHQSSSSINILSVSLLQYLLLYQKSKI